MSGEIKKIGILTSGGDAPGMNAAVRAIARTALSKGYQVMGVKHGYNGLLQEEIYEMNIRSVSEIIHRGGTILHTARCLEFIKLTGQQLAAANCRKHGIDAMIVVGGDGSFRGCLDLVKQGIPCIGVPATIDNDIGCSEYTIGYDTAMNTAIESIDKLRDTTQSHDRCSVVEVMGRNCGDLALNVGIATGALCSLIPEVKYNLQKDVVNRMLFAKGTGKKHYIIVVAEGAGKAFSLAEKIQQLSGIDSRATVLGHVQRGGAPSLMDRTMATRMGFHAIKILEEGKVNRVVALKGSDILDYDIAEALKMKQEIDPTLLEIAQTASQ